ncbi:DUF7289 family protein [Halorubrum halodurans]|uniref:DUF7289 family protein n=1 Tax=Halorubrum halodurans TaxID=1383851 RepID=UPI001179CB12|nr:hypothetical protein [Halorubrum halodurans]
MPDPKHRFTRDTRAVTSTVGYVLLIAIVITSSVAVLGTGITVITGTQTTADHEAAANAMTHLDAEIQLVAFTPEPGSQHQHVDLETGRSEQLTIEDTGKIQLELQERRNGTGTYTTVDRPLNQDLHALVYQTEHRAITYQAGGVWAITPGDPGTAEMISPPELSKNGNTTTIPIVTIRNNPGFVSTDGTIDVTRSSDSDRIFPETRSDDTLSNPVAADQRIVLTITTEYYQAWGDYFETRLDVDPEYDHENQSVTVTITGNSDPVTFVHSSQTEIEVTDS